MNYKEKQAYWRNKSARRYIHVSSYGLGEKGITYDVGSNKKKGKRAK